MAFVDFVALKQRLSIEQTAVFSGLNTKPTGGQLSELPRKGRRACDRHHAGEGLFYCFPVLSRQEGGDAIESNGRSGLDVRRKVPWYCTPSSLTASALSSSRNCLRSWLSENATWHNSTPSARGELFLWNGCAYGPTCRIKLTARERCSPSTRPN